jgi:hypothetical protein
MSSDGFGVDDVGTSARVDDVIKPYPGLYAGLLSNETDALLAGLLLEQRAARTGEDPTTSAAGKKQNPNSVGGTYTSVSGDVDADEWARIKIGFVSSEIDLRFDGGIEVAYTNSSPASEGEDIIEYSGKLSPVVGTEVNTGNVWLRAQSGTVTVDVEVWS